jgi:hypothetical protein
MNVSIYYAVDSGITKVLDTQLPSGTVLYHIDEPDIFRIFCTDLVYRKISDNGHLKVGKITLLNVLSHIDNKRKAIFFRSQNLNTMSTEPGVIKEAERLYSKFGSQAAEVAKELRNIDSHSEHYFWTDVIVYLNDMQRVSVWSKMR